MSQRRVVTFQDQPRHRDVASPLLHRGVCECCGDRTVVSCVYPMKHSRRFCNVCHRWGVVTTLFNANQRDCHTTTRTLWLPV